MVRTMCAADEILDQVRQLYRQLQRLPSEYAVKRHTAEYLAIEGAIRTLSARYVSLTTRGDDSQYVEALSYRVDRQTPDSTAA